MSFTYKITLKPIGAYYFGGEESFTSAPLDAVLSSDQKAKEYFKKRQGYFAKSQELPQQSQILGMLHKELYRQNKLLLYFKNFVRVPKNDEYSSKMNEIKKSICSLSPLYLEKQGSLYIPTPYDNELTLVKKANSSAYINGRPIDVGALALQKCDGKFFGAKDYLSASYVSVNKGYESNDSLFKSHTQIQTQTLDYKQDNDEQLFKVTKYHLDDAYHFVTYLTVSSDKYMHEGNYIVELGGERSSFTMSITQKDAPDMMTFSFLSKEQARIVLLSDSKVEAKIFEHCHLTLAQKRIVRTINHPNKTDRFKKSTKSIFLTRASVLFPKNKEAVQEIITILKEDTHNQKLGYNQYLDLTHGGNYEPKTI